MAIETIFSSPLGQVVLLFLLIFTIVFAVLQKSEILGKGKKQIDALVALAIGLLVCGVGSVLDFVQRMIPFMAIVLVILFVFLLLLSFMFKEGEFKLQGWMQIVLGIIIFIAVVIAVLIFTGGWSYITDFFGNNGNWTSNIILVVVIIIVVIVAFFGSGEKK